MPDVKLNRSDARNPAPYAQAKAEAQKPRGNLVIVDDVTESGMKPAPREFQDGKQDPLVRLEGRKSLVTADSTLVTREGMRDPADYKAPAGPGRARVQALGPAQLLGRPAQDQQEALAKSLPAEEA